MLADPILNRFDVLSIRKRETGALRTSRRLTFMPFELRRAPDHWERSARAPTLRGESGHGLEPRRARADGDENQCRRGAAAQCPSQWRGDSGGHRRPVAGAPCDGRRRYGGAGLRGLGGTARPYGPQGLPIGAARRPRVAGSVPGASARGPRHGRSRLSGRAIRLVLGRLAVRHFASASDSASAAPGGRDGTEGMMAESGWKVHCRF